jgi:hypothetical protein
VQIPSLDDFHVLKAGVMTQISEIKNMALEVWGKDKIILFEIDLLCFDLIYLFFREHSIEAFFIERLLIEDFTTDVNEYTGLKD